MYRALGARYGYTPQQIADMTPAQQLMMANLEGDVLTFNSQREYQNWLAGRG